MPHAQPRGSALYRLEAFGLQNPWNLWGLQEGTLSDLCRGCSGRRIEIQRPCGCTERHRANRPWYLCDECTIEDGCKHCRRRCTVCHGTGVTDDEVFAEDFGDGESLRVAVEVFDVPINFHEKRSDREARAL